MYKRILVPLDGSERAERILPYVEEMASVHGSTVILIQVIEPAATMVTPYDMVPYYDAELMERWVDEAKDYLKEVQSRLAGHEIATKAFVEQGPVVRTILEVAEREEVDMIAHASHGRTGLARVFYGSVAAGLLQQTDRPLLLIRSSG